MPYPYRPMLSRYVVYMEWVRRDCYGNAVSRQVRSPDLSDFLHSIPVHSFLRALEYYAYREIPFPRGVMQFFLLRLNRSVPRASMLRVAKRLVKAGILKEDPLTRTYIFGPEYKEAP